jgi:hypothetical protein
MRHALEIAFAAAVAIGLAGRGAAADPTVDHVFTAPTAWLPKENVIVGTGSLDLRALADKRFESALYVGYGLGGLAEVDVGEDTDVRGCTNAVCSGTDRPVPIVLGRASFRLGARQNALFPGMPAVVIGVRKSFAASGSFDGTRVAEAYVVASREVGPLRAHFGAAVLDAGFADVTLGPTLHPLAGLEWTPSQYPKTTLMGDVTWVPLFKSEPTLGDRVETEWVAGWGVRYQAFPWGAVELAVRHRENEGLGDSTVMVRVSGSIDPRKP